MTQKTMTCDRVVWGSVHTEDTMTAPAGEIAETVTIPKTEYDALVACFHELGNVHNRIQQREVLAEMQSWRDANATNRFPAVIQGWIDQMVRDLRVGSALCDAIHNVGETVESSAAADRTTRERIGTTLRELEQQRREVIARPCAACGHAYSDHEHSQTTEKCWNPRVRLNDMKPCRCKRFVDPCEVLT